MSKRELKKYLNGLSKRQLEEHLLDLYGRFKEVKVFYNFVFNPKEEKLLEDCKFKISKEYFPVNNRKPKKRRSVAQKQIKHFIQIGVDPFIIAEIMVFNIEVAQRFASDKPFTQDAFYKSMLKSYIEAINYIFENGLDTEFKKRLIDISETATELKWMNAIAFNNVSS